MSWPRWWPGVSADAVRPAPDGLVGSAALVAFRAPGGYRLRLGLTVVAAEPPHSVRLAADGDLVGTAEVTLTPDDAGCRVRIGWDVEPARGWMRVSGPLLRGGFQASHRAVMRAGERGLVAELAGPATGR